MLNAEFSSQTTRHTALCTKHCYFSNPLPTLFYKRTIKNNNLGKNAMHSFGIRDNSNLFTYFKVDHIHLGAMRNKETAVNFIHSQVVPSAVA